MGSAIGEDDACCLFFRSAARRYMEVDGDLSKFDGVMRVVCGEGSAKTEVLSPQSEMLHNLFTAAVPEDQWRGRPEIIGWLYQFYAAEQRSALKSPASCSSRLSAVTRRFTPDWLARLLVENSLGMLWLEDRPRSGLSQHLPYLLDRPRSAAGCRSRAPREYTLLDPCCGSGQILVAAYNLLRRIYLECGYAPEALARLILEENLYGVDIDPHVVRVCAFTLLITALRDNPGLLDEEPVRLNIAAAESRDGVAAGSLARTALWNISSYRCVVTNPPYLSVRFMDDGLRRFAEREYPHSKADLYAMFIERALELTAADGLSALLTMHGWMFLPSFRALRELVLERAALALLVHLGRGAFEAISGEVVQTAACVLRPAGSSEGLCIDLTRGRDQEKQQMLVRGEAPVYRRTSRFFSRMPDCALAYWADEQTQTLFSEGTPLGEIVQIRQGLATGDNDTFVRRWHEVPTSAITFDMRAALQPPAAPAERPWVPYNKGGGRRRWYGNQEFVIRFDSSAAAALSRQGNCLPSRRFYFRPAITWSLVSSKSSRHTPEFRNASTTYSS